MSSLEYRLDGLEAAVKANLANYAGSVTDVLKEACASAAKSCLADIKANSPKLTGEYRKGWKLKIIKNDALGVEYRVYNAKKPYLTHLLEKGHVKVNGGRVEAIPHIRPAEERAAQQLVQLIEEGLKR